MTYNSLSYKLSLLFFVLVASVIHSNAQSGPNSQATGCHNCPTLGLQINAAYDGECGYAFDYTGLITCDVVSAEWDFGLGNGTATGNHVYAEFLPGNRTVTLTLILSDGTNTCTKKLSTTVFVDPNNCNPFLTCTGGAGMLQNTNLGINVGPICIVDFWRTSSPAPNSPWQIIAMTWNFGDGNISHDVYAGVSHQYDRPGTYTACMTVTISDGVDTCQKKVCRTFTVTCTRKKESDFGTAPLEIFPNPAQVGSRLTLRGDLDLSVREILLTDVQGRTIARWNISGNGGSEQVFRIPSGTTPGIYFLRSDSPAMPVQKLIVK